MIDFAARHGFGGVLAEGWNVGWDGDWFATGDDFSFTKATPDFDIAALSAYARRKGVRIIGPSRDQRQHRQYEKAARGRLDLYQRLGIDSVKTGYVADAGGVQATDAQGRPIFEWHEGPAHGPAPSQVVQEAAKRRIAVNPHEPIKDTGLRRTYPNWITPRGPARHGV
jgi:alpha-glucosidase